MYTLYLSSFFSADDMGLGKTLSMISLILDSKKQRSFISRSKNTDDNMLSTNGTLVVVPLTLLRMWETEIRSKVRSGLLSVTIYHGANRAKDPYEWDFPSFSNLNLIFSNFLYPPLISSIMYTFLLFVFSFSV